MPASPSAEPPQIAVVVPVFNEEGAAVPLAREIVRAFAGRNVELVFVDDASTDGTRAALLAARGEIPQLRVVAHAANAGQSRAVRTGVRHARAETIVTMDGDGQNDPADAPRLVARLEASPDVALVAGRRVGRRDPPAKLLASRLANGVRGRLLRDGADDTACGLKAFRRQAFLELPYFDHMHRYLPALMRRERMGVVFEDVSHRPRVTGRSKYTNLGRLADAATDLAGVIWLIARARTPGPVSEG